MACPICLGEKLPEDCLMVEPNGKRLKLQGRVNAIIDINSEGKPKAHYPPFADYLTVPLYPRRGRGKVKYLKFKTQAELNRWPFEVNAHFIVQGCLHHAVHNRTERELVFDITSVEPA